MQGSRAPGDGEIQRLDPSRGATEQESRSSQAQHRSLDRVAPLESADADLDLQDCDDTIINFLARCRVAHARTLGF